MRNVLRLFPLACAALMLWTLAPRARADEWNKRTIVTFNQPVEIPGKVLPAGTYVFKLMDSQSDRHIVQIYNKDENKLYGTILAVPDYRMEPSGKTVITFEERAHNAPEAIQAWFYPGDNFGQEFVYPKTRAVSLAKASNQHVLSMPESSASNLNQPNANQQSSSVANLKKAPVKAEQPSGQEVELAQVHPPAQPPPAPAATNAPATASTHHAAARKARTMPQTASQWPFELLAGLCLLSLGLVLRRSVA